MRFTLKQLKLRQNRQRAGDILEARLGRRAQQRDVMTFIKLQREGRNPDSFIQELRKKYHGLRVRTPQKYVPKKKNTRKVRPYRRTPSIVQQEEPQEAPQEAPQEKPQAPQEEPPHSERVVSAHNDLQPVLM